jgi:hypothetical protein
VGARGLDEGRARAGGRGGRRSGVGRVGGRRAGQAHEAAGDLVLLVLRAHGFQIHLEEVAGGSAQGAAHGGADAGNGDHGAEGTAGHGQDLLGHALDEAADGAAGHPADHAADLPEELAEELIQLFLAGYGQELGGQFHLVGLAEHARLAGVLEGLVRLE